MKAMVTWGLLAAWAVHDAEELATMANRLGMSQQHVNVSIGLMGGVMAAASAAGALSDGRNAFFRAALAGFGAHGVVHLLQSAAVRGYTPGVVTAPLVVIPFSVWAWRQLEDTDAKASTLKGLALLPVALAGVHGLAHLLTRKR